MASRSPPAKRRKLSTAATETAPLSQQPVVLAEGTSAPIHDWSGQAAPGLHVNPNPAPFLIATASGTRGHEIVELERGLDELLEPAPATTVPLGLFSTLENRTIVTNSVAMENDDEEEEEEEEDGDAMDVKKDVSVGDSVQDALRSEFRRLFLFDNAIETPLFDKVLEMRAPDHEYMADELNMQAKVAPMGLDQSFVMQHFKQNLPATHPVDSNTLSSCPVLRKKYFELWLQAPESARQRFPQCYYGEACLCMRMAPRDGSIDMDRRLPPGILTGDISMTQRRAQATVDPIAALRARDRATFTNSPTQGFICPQFMLPATLRQWQFSGGKMDLPPGPCLVCHIAEVNYTHHMITSGNYHGGTDELKRNMFQVHVDQVGEFRSDVCLPMLPHHPDLGAVIVGHFPRFVTTDFDYSSRLVSTIKHKIPILQWVGVDFRPSSAK